MEREDEFDVVPAGFKKSVPSPDLFVDLVALAESDRRREGQLITLPATVMPDKDTQVAYESRRRMAERESERKKKQQEADAAAAAMAATRASLKSEGASPMEVDSAPAPAAAAAEVESVSADSSAPSVSAAAEPAAPSTPGGSSMKRPLEVAAASAATNGVGAAEEDSNKRQKLDQ